MQSDALCKVKELKIMYFRTSLCGLLLYERQIVKLAAINNIKSETYITVIKSLRVLISYSLIGDICKEHEHV